jgi:hypothetical protein
MLHDTERSSQGIVNLANERIKHPKWHESLHSFLADLQTDTNPAGSNAHIAQAHVAFAGDQSAQLVCLNPRHSKTFSHVSSDCTDPIWGPLWKDHKIDPKTGKPEDGSSIPPPTKQTSESSTDGQWYPHNKHQLQAVILLNPRNAIQVFSVLSACTSRNCNSDADCRKKVKYAARQQKWSNKSSSSASNAPAAATKVAHLAGSGHSEFHAQVAQLSGTVNQLVEALSKKRKHGGAPMEEEV